MNTTTETAPTLLVIDDEEGMRLIVEGVGELAGYRCFGANGVRDVMQALDMQPDVIALDVSMPDMDGIEVLWELHRRRSRAALVLMSGFDAVTLEAAQQIALGGGRRLLASMVKPLNLQRLKELLVEYRVG